MVILFRVYGFGGKGSGWSEGARVEWRNAYFDILSVIIINTGYPRPSASHLSAFYFLTETKSGCDLKYDSWLIYCINDSKQIFA